MIFLSAFHMRSAKSQKPHGGSLNNAFVKLTTAFSKLLFIRHVRGSSGKPAK